MVTGSKLLLVTTTSKVNVPPGAGMLSGFAVFTTSMVGGMSVIVTVASSSSVAVVPWASVTTTVTTSVCAVPASPKTFPVNVQGADEAPGASVVPIRAPQVEPGRMARLPKTLSLSDVIVTVSLLLLVTTAVKVNSPPGSGRESGFAVFTTWTVGIRLVMVTVASSVSVTVLPLTSVPTTVTVSVCWAPAGPLKFPGKVHGALLAPGARVVPIRAPQVEPGMVATLP